MSKERIISMAIIGLLSIAVYAQSVERQQMVLTKGAPNHMYLNVEVPAGELMIKSSGNCGMSIAKLAAPDSGIWPKIVTSPDRNGNHHRRIYLQNQLAQARSKAVTNLRTREHLVNIDSYRSKEELSTQYHHDPNLSTDLDLQLGVGTAKLDLSGMTLQNISIRSAFANVFVTYRMPNQANMKKMDIHAARANVVLENVEKANVELVSIQNDMGETRLSIGDGNVHKSTIYLQSGVGNCTLVVHEKQPVMIVLKRGLFSKLNNQGNFEKLQSEKEVYVNEAYHANPQQVTKIICSLDLGDITLVKN